MDMTNRIDGPRRQPKGGAAAASFAIRPAAVAEALWRRLWLIVLCGALAALLAAVLGLAMPRSYTSSAQLLIDPRGLQVVDKDITPQAREPDLSVSIIESEMRFLASDLVLQRVIDRVGLAKADDGGGPKPSSMPGWLASAVAQVGVLRDQAKAMLGRTDAAMSDQQAAMFSLQKGLRISRPPNTYVLDVAVTHKDRDLAARVANAIAAEYIGARFDSRATISRRASETIDGRLDELRTKVRDADAAVERYKEGKGLVSSSGRLLADQRMGEVSTQLQVARGETVRAQTRVDEVRAARRARDSTEAGLEALQSATLERLRSNQAVARQREAALSATLLPSHPLYRQVRQEIRATESSINQELSRIGDTATAALERARATQQALDRQLQELKALSVRDGAALVELRELERIAEANRAIYQTFLTRTRELVEQQRIDPNSAVLLSHAEPARSANGPGLMPLIAAASMAGLGLGAAFALRRDHLDPRVRSHLQLETLVGADGMHRVPLPMPRRLSAKAGSDAERALYFVAEPASPMAEAMGRLQRDLVKAGRRTMPLVYLVVAAEPFQGKSTVALNLAVAAARAGETVLLVDADREAMVATRAAGASELPGLAEVMLGDTGCTEAIVKRSEPPVDLLPAGKLAELRPSRLSLDRISSTLLTPLANYDVVVVDAATVGRDRLGMALAGRADACLLVVQEGAGQKAAVEEAARWLDGVSGGDMHVVLVCPR